jgi:hypothetical protein
MAKRKSIKTMVAAPVEKLVLPASKPRNPVLAALKSASTAKRAGKHVKSEAALRREANVALLTQLKKGA